MSARLCLAAAVLWVLTMATVAWVFVKGRTAAPDVDARTVVILAPSERDLILGEMRLLLKAVHGVILGLSEDPPAATGMEESARAAGIGMAEDVNPAVMLKLPLAFKQMGMSVHRDMDALADAIAAQETPPQILKRLSSLTARCTTCHDMYRLVGQE